MGRWFGKSKEDYPRAEEMKKEAGIVVAVSDESERRQKKICELNAILNKAIDITKPTTSIQDLENSVKELEGKFMEQVDPYLRIRNIDKFANLKMAWSRWIRQVIADLYVMYELTYNLEHSAIPVNIPEEQKQLEKAKQLSNAKGEALTVHNFVQKHVYALGAYVAAASWDDKDITPKTVLSIQTPVIWGKYGEVPRGYEDGLKGSE